MTTSEIDLGCVEDVTSGETYQIKLRYGMSGVRNPELGIGCRWEPLAEWKDHWTLISIEEGLGLIPGTGGDDMEDLFLAAERAAKGEIEGDLHIKCRWREDQIKKCDLCGKEGNYNPSKWNAGIIDDKGCLVCRKQPCKQSTPPAKPGER